MRTFLSITLLLVAIGCFAAPLKLETDGYPVANFALTVNASETGDLYGPILLNPGKLGEWLSPVGTVSFAVRKEGKQHLFSEFRQKQVSRSFPFVKNSYGKSLLIRSDIVIETFCPLSINDPETSSLPALLLEITCSNPSADIETFDLQLTPDSSFVENLEPFKTRGYSGIGNTKRKIACNAETEWDNQVLLLPVSLKGGEEKKYRVLFTFYDDNWISSVNFSDIEEITGYIFKTWSALKTKTTLFSEAIPETGDQVLDKYLRWYMIPGISLTKWTKKSEVLTMGYCELNQRDSYWTSWLHLVFFRDLERKMIEESIFWQQPSGKIPTTILPLIERDDDLDINAFFILRVTRFYQYYHNKEELQTYWPALKKAMDWLISRDESDSGLPAQKSFWGDWKDVTGVEGRKYSPFSCLIYLAALKQMICLSEVCGDETNRIRYDRAYRKGYVFINKSVEDGGLWNGNYYSQIWRDGEKNDRILQDQTIGILFDVVPHDRAQKIIESLNNKSLTPYGICETFPYYPKSFGYAPGTYHNGAVWPWVSFMDCWSRIRLGREKEAIDLIKRVAYADLVASGDWSPNEHINSQTGENLGFQLQGWNAALFGLVYFGLIHTGILP